MTSSKSMEFKMFKESHSYYLDLARHCRQSLSQLFGIQRRRLCKANQMQFEHWTAYLLSRTELADSIIFHALHLARRVSLSYEISNIDPVPARFLERILLSSLILASAYSLDSTFPLSSWRIASRKIFTVKELDIGQMELFRCLDFTLRESGQDLNKILKDEEENWMRSKREIFVDLGVPEGLDSTGSIKQGEKVGYEDDIVNALHVTCLA